MSELTPFRKQQIIINTWHGGGAYKKIFANDDNWWTIKYSKFLSKHTSYFISSCQLFTNFISQSLHMKKQIFLPIGMPRNDIFFSKDKINKAESQVRNYYNIDKEYFIVLYAPTFREPNQSLNSNLSFTLLEQVIKEKFGRKICLLYRAHHFITDVNLKVNNKAKIFNVSEYSDMQELLCAANMLISDYSSCIWDYSILNRPCFLFTPDLCKYQSERNFYIPIEKWGFPIAKSNQELAQNILSFDQFNFSLKMEQHHFNLQTFENGTATEKIIKLILSDEILQ